MDWISGREVYKNERLKEPEVLEEEDHEFYELKLFVNGTSVISIRAMNNLREILEKNIPGRYQLEIIDAHQQPELTQSENVSATPMLIKKSPAPLRRMVGDMSDEQKVLKGLGLR